MINKRDVGYEYEAKAAKYLESFGYRIIEKNYNSKTGEIDLIARDQEYYVFVEVKYRANTRNGYPEEAIDHRKMRHISNTAKLYLMRHGLSEFTPCRFDVVVILENEMKLIKNAFEAV